MRAIADKPSFRLRAQALQQGLGREDGVAKLVAAIEAKLSAASALLTASVQDEQL